MPWLPALAGLGLYDLWLIHSGKESLTGCAKRNRITTYAMLGYIGAHLTGTLPPSADLFYRLKLDYRR